MRRLLSFNIEDVSARTAFLVHAVMTVALALWLWASATTPMSAPVFAAGIVTISLPWFISAWNDTKPGGAS